MSRDYAEGTTVTVEKTKAELDALLGKHGATQRGIMQGEDRAQVAFVIQGRHYRLDVPLPTIALNPAKSDWEQKNCPRGWSGWGVEKRKDFVRKTLEQKSRERWRAVLLMLKAKLELCRLQISSVEREFLSDLVLPNGRTVGAMVEAQIKEVMSGEAPRLLSQ